MTFCSCHGTVSACCAQNVSTSIYCDVNLHQTILYLCPFGRAVRSCWRRKRGQTHILTFPRKLFFSGCMEPFDVPKQSVPIHQACDISFGLFLCSLEGVKTRPQRFVLYERTTEVRGSNPTEVVFPLFLKCIRFSTRQPGPRQNPLKNRSASYLYCIPGTRMIFITII